MQKHQEHFHANAADDPMTAADVKAQGHDRMPSPFDPNPKFVLVVDDSPLILNAIKAALGQSGYIVITAKDGIEAIELVPMFPFLIIITDIEMPNCDGIEAT